jgi:hypothetical protein
MNAEALGATTMNKQKQEKKELDPNEVVRQCDGEKWFGYKNTQIREKIKNGEIPEPFDLSDTGRAKAWYGWQIIQHQKERIAAAAAKRAKFSKRAEA